MPQKKPFVTLAQARAIAAEIPTPFHLYDEAGIRENARKVNAAFSWNKGFKEYFAVKATPNPYILKILQEEGCGVDCSSYTELLMGEACGFTGSDIMFSSNETPAQDMQKAYELGAYINLDDLTHVDFLKETAGIPKTVCCRYNPGGVFELGNGIMDNPGDAKYGMSEDQMAEAYTRLMALGAEEFGIHSFLASNTVTDDYYPKLAGILFELAVRLHKRTGAKIKFINLSGGVGIAYRPDQRSNDIAAIGEGVRKKFEEILVPAGMGDVAIFTEMGRFMLAPYGALITTAIHEKHIYKEYIGVDACAANLMRPACTALTTTSRCWARRKLPATTSTMWSAACARITISLPSTACCLKSTRATSSLSTMPVPTASRWATLQRQAAHAPKCCLKPDGSFRRFAVPRLRPTTLPPSTLRRSSKNNRKTKADVPQRVHLLFAYFVF